MSDNESNNETKEEKVVLSEEDVKNIKDYFQHFDIHCPDYLTESCDKFKGEINIDNQKLLKMQLCKAMLSSEHESFQDKMFETVKERSDKALYELQFERSLTEELSVDESEKEEK